MIKKELLPLTVSGIAFVNILYDKRKELLPLPVSRIAFVNILYDK